MNHISILCSDSMLSQNDTMVLSAWWLLGASEKYHRSLIAASSPSICHDIGKVIPRDFNSFTTFDHYHCIMTIFCHSFPIFDHYGKLHPPPSMDCNPTNSGHGHLREFRGEACGNMPRLSECVVWIRVNPIGDTTCVELFLCDEDLVMGIGSELA